MKEIPLSSGKVTIVDDADFEELSKWRWHAAESKSKVSVFVYVMRRSPTGATLYMHRVIMGAPKGVRVDHRNGDTLDNRRENLRLATAGQNRANGGPSSRNYAGFRGVSKDGPGHWIVRVYSEGRRYYIGSFPSPEGAARAYDLAARRIHGEFARPNFPDE